MQKLLVIEDEIDTSKFIKTTLEDEGFKVETALTGRDGLRKLERDDFDLVTLDIFMPGMDGWSVLEEIKQDKKLKTTPIIVYTILDTKSAIKKTKEMKAIFITKSPDSTKLIDKAKEILVKQKRKM